MTLNNLKEEINEIYRKYLPLFQELSEYIPKGQGMSEEVYSLINGAYGAYKEAKRAVERYWGSSLLELEDGTTVGDKESNLDLDPYLLAFGYINSGDDTPIPELLSIIKEYFSAALEMKDRPKPSLTLEGKVHLDDISEIKSKRYEVLDLSKAEWGVEEEEWSTCLWSHSGPRRERSGVRKVEVLSRLLETVRAEKVILPDDIQRRHINRIAANRNVGIAYVGPDCRLFSMQGDVLMNKKGTKVIYAPIPN